MGRATLLILLTLTAGCSTSKNFSPQSSVQTFSIERYMGKWYEIARFPHRFERDLVGVTATYTLRNDGKVDVINRGYKHTLEGEVKSAKAIARIIDAEEPWRLRVYFFWPFGAEYTILHLDEEDYQWALVGSSSPNYLWILSREPKMGDETYQMLLEKARELGYDLQKIELVQQRI